MENFAALRKASEADSQASNVAREYTIAILESPRSPLGASEVATEYTIVIHKSSRAAPRLPGEYRSVLRLHSPVPEDSQRVCKVCHSKLTFTTSGGSRSFWDRTIDFTDAPATSLSSQ
ncbi:hypothetical protein BDD12DRAFT_888399 [Trichophaea hybrida]|nr:hypothetical protein BDD12DRAFT_888399 [Trichophaea hybrida]